MQQVDLPMLSFCSHDFGNDINWLKIRIVGFFFKEGMRLQYRDRKHGRDKRRPHGLRPSSSKGFIIKSSVYHWGEQCH